MKKRAGWGIFAFGIVGAVLGLLVEWAAPLVFPSLVIRDGMIWGAFAGLCVGYVPNLRYMGSQITRREDKGLNLVVGVVSFLVISAIVVLLMFFVFWVASLFSR